MELDREWFARDTLAVARGLLGKFLVVAGSEGERAYMITETEMYDGHNDLASHASRGKTPRTEVMFGPAGVWYVYLIYGMYDMLNIVTREDGYPAAVLIRGIEGYDGPGKLTKALGITRAKFNYLPVARESGLWIEDRGVALLDARIEATPRIGVDYAGPEWAGKPWRFVLRR